MCWPLVTCPLRLDLVLVTSIGNICTRQLTLYGWFSLKCVSLDVIAHSIEHPWTVKHFTFDLTCDVISDHKVNEISISSIVFTGLSKAVWILWICLVVPEIRGGAKNSPPATRSRYNQTPTRARVNHIFQESRHGFWRHSWPLPTGSWKSNSSSVLMPKSARKCPNREATWRTTWRTG